MIHNHEVSSSILDLATRKKPLLRLNLKWLLFFDTQFDEGELRFITGELIS